MRDATKTLGTLILDGVNGTRGTTILGLPGVTDFAIHDNVLVRGDKTYVTTDHANMHLVIDGSLTVMNQGTFQADGTIDVAQGVTVDGGTLAVDRLNAARLDVVHSGVVTTTGGSVSVMHRLDLQVSGTVTVDGTSAIDVSNEGYPAGRTTGNTATGGATGYSGGSYGGLGGAYFGDTNAVYGDYAHPADWGSGGAAGAGGGLVEIDAAAMVLDGAVRAGGQNSNAGAGAGGGVWIDIAGQLSGAGSISANGGNSNTCGGGGGRIAVYANSFSTFNTDNITAIGSGDYIHGGAGTVYLSHDVGDNSPNLTLAPSVTTQPVNITVTAGAIAIFTTAASGTPTPSVQWQVSTNNGATWNNISGATSTTYSLTTVTGNNASQYRASFTNVAGTTTTNPATLTVTQPFSVLTTFKLTSFVGLNTGTFTLVDFQDSRALLSPTTYTATINWGDGHFDTNVPVVHSVADGTTVHVSGSHTYSAAGTYLPNVTLTNSVGTSLSTTSANTSTVYVGADISSLVSVTRSAVIKNRTTGLYYSTVTITNISGGTLIGDIDLVLLNLTPGVTLTGGSGTTAAGTDPWVRFSTKGLAAGKSVSLSLSFALPTNVTAFNYTFKTFSVID